MFDDDYGTQKRKESKKIEEKWETILKNILEEIRRSPPKYSKKRKKYRYRSNDDYALPQNTYAENQSTNFNQEPISQSRQQISIRQPFPQQTEKY